eukprot:EG_transcript_7848
MAGPPLWAALGALGLGLVYAALAPGRPDVQWHVAPPSLRATDGENLLHSTLPMTRPRRLRLWSGPSLFPVDVAGGDRPAQQRHTVQQLPPDWGPGVPSTTVALGPTPHPGPLLFLLIFAAAYARLIVRMYRQSQAQGPNSLLVNIETCPIPIPTLPNSDRATASPPPARWDLRVRLGTTEADAKAMAAIVHAEFEDRPPPWWAPGQPRSRQEWQDRIAALLDARRLVKAQRRLLRKELAATRTPGTGPSPRAEQRVRRRLWELRAKQMRAFLMVEARRGPGPDPVGPSPPPWEAVGCAMISLAVPNALLPPPFPSAHPPQFYISNLAVRRDARRRGVARRLLAACETLCARWGYPVVTLHVDEGNGPAEALYRGAQYGWVRCPQVFWGVRRRLLVKRVTPVVWAVDAPRPTSAASSLGGYTAADGTFVWDVPAPPSGGPPEP